MGEIICANILCHHDVLVFGSYSTHVIQKVFKRESGLYRIVAFAQSKEFKNKVILRIIESCKLRLFVSYLQVIKPPKIII